MTVRVVTAAQSAARDAAAIAAGTSSQALMHRAGTGAARLILDRFSSRAAEGTVVFAGPGNNGGDGWIVAGELARQGIPVHVVQVGESRTPDARAARDAATPFVAQGSPPPRAALVVDAILGTGAHGALRGGVAAAAAEMRQRGAAGATIVALDLPTGLDATTGQPADGAIVAELTISFGTIKRGHLLRRDACGVVVVADIGLDVHGELDDGAPLLADAHSVRQTIPAFDFDAHKGVRRRVLMVGGADGMAGAITLAARAAFRTGVGMVRACVSPASVVPVQLGVMEATTVAWPSAGELPDESLVEWGDALLIGPGLGNDAEARARVETWLAATRAPALLDADALNAFAGDAAALGAQLHGRRAIVTPHAAEFARLASRPMSAVLHERFEVGAFLARTVGVVVLLKGTPTIVTAPDGRCVVSATGTPALATAGSGDVLSGVATTLLAQLEDPFAAAWCAAWVHGRAAELANEGRPARGVVLDDILRALGDVWRFEEPPLPTGVLAELPAVGHA